MGAIALVPKLNEVNIMTNFAIIEDTSFSTKQGSALGSWGDAVFITSLSWDAQTRSIVVFCSDNERRVCRVDRLSSEEFAKKLTAALRLVRDQHIPVCFRAAGNNSNKRWFASIGFRKPHFTVA